MSPKTEPTNPAPDHAGTGAPMPSGLYLVATPIGAARDITLRALDILRSADVIAAEDTRRARKLLEIHGVKRAGRPLVSYHDHSGDSARDALLSAVAEGQTVAYLSDAGTPLVADPGYALARAVIEMGGAVHTAPGPSALLAALLVSGLPSDRFLFAGFPPRGGKLTAWLESQKAAAATLIFYESPKRIHKVLGELAQVFGDDVPMALCRELTKRHEEVLRGTVARVRDEIAERDLKGEIVIVVGAPRAAEVSDDVIKSELETSLGRLSLKAAVAEVSDRLQQPRRKVYQIALEMKAER